MTQKIATLRNEYLPNDHNLRGTVMACTLVATDVAVCVMSLVFAGALAGPGTIAQTSHLLLPNVHEPRVLWDWPAMVALCWLIAHFAGRSHYRSRIPFWNEIGTVIAGAAIAFAIDTGLDVIVMRQGVGVRDVASWVLL